MRSQLRLGSGLSWVFVWLLAAASPVLFLLAPSTLTFWLGIVLPVPVFALAIWRAEQNGLADSLGGATDGGVWGPPGDLGGF